MTSFVKDGYFYTGKNINKGGNYTPVVADTNPSNILIERGYHLCKSHPKFEPNFKLRFTAADNKLLNNPLLNLLFENET